MTDKLNFYETLYLVRPDIESGGLAVIQDKIASALKENQGETIKNEKWADRDLAYEVQGYRRGTYHIVTYKALPGVVAVVEKHLGFHKSEVMRFITVSVEEEQAHGREPKKPAEPAKADGEKPTERAGFSHRTRARSTTTQESNQWKSAESPRKREGEK